MTSVLTHPTLTSVSPPLATRDRLAIVAMDGIFPDALDSAQLWDNILRRHTSVSRVEDRYLSPHLREQLGSVLGALIPPVQIRPQKFRMPPSTTRNFDPRILPMMDVVDRTLASYPDLPRQRTRVILCCQKMIPKEEASSSVSRRLRVLSALEEVESLKRVPLDLVAQIKQEFTDAYDRQFPNPGFEGFLAESGSLMTSIISKTFDLGGGHITMDATCASTMAATQMAWDALVSGHCDAAVIVALSVEVVPSRFRHYAQMGLLAKDAVLPFDAHATGSAIGEGIGVMVVRRLADAEAAGDRVYGVVRGIGFSSDGAGSGFVSPQQEGQVRAMQAAYEMAEVDPGDVRLVEAHATGTQKGDLTELQSMDAIFGKPSDAEQGFVTGSVKGNIGHLLAASGMVGLFKACYSLNRGVLPPTIFNTPRRELQEQFNQFRLLDQPQSWPNEDPYRLAAVSSFGFGGVNAHMILESHPSTAQGLPSSVPSFFAVSDLKRSEMQLSPPAYGINGHTVSRVEANGEAQVMNTSHPTDQLQTRSDAEIEFGVLEIIAECTGYEVEELQLDHDLDADLGVDSLKHVEILLKVGQRFRVQAQEDDQITDYPTIAALVKLAQERQNTATGDQPAGLMAGLMAGLEQAGMDLPPDAMSQFNEGMATVAPPAPSNSRSADPAPQPSPIPPAPVTSSPGAHSETTLNRVKCTVAALRNYEPEWLEPHLQLKSDLGLTPTEFSQVFAQLQLPENGQQDYSLQDLAVVLQKLDAPAQADPIEPMSLSSTSQEWVLVYGQATPGSPDLAKRIQELLTHASAPVLQLPGAGSHHLALVLDRTQPHLLDHLSGLLRQDNSVPEQDLWWGQPKGPAPLLSLIFPGSGSLYPGLLEELGSLHPVVQEVIDAATRTFQALVGAELCFDSSRDPLWQRPATVTVSTAIARLLQTFGIQPGLVGGHSVGELTACHIAGAFDLAELIRLTTAPFKGLTTYPEGAMVALIGPETLSMQLVQKSRGRVVVSNRNSTQQLVVSGQMDDIQALMEQALALGIQPHRLDVATAYHSPLLNQAHQQYREALLATQFQIPSVPVVSGLTADVLPWSSLDSSQTRALLDCAFIAPVNFPAQLQRMQNLGMGTLIDVGPTSRLSRLAQDTLCADPVEILVANRTKRSSRKVFLELLAQLYHLGYPVTPPPDLRPSASVTIPTAPEAILPTPASESSQVWEATSTPATLDRPEINGYQIPATVLDPPIIDQPAPMLHQGLSSCPMLLQPIAVVGMGAIMPDAENLQEFWQNILSGHDAIRVIPQDTPYRWKLSTYYNPDPKAVDKTYSKIGAFVPNFKFKPIEFRITPKTALQMDRAQKMALLATREAFQDSGYQDRPFDRKRVKVIIGTSVPEHHDLGAPRLVFDEVVEAFAQSEVFCSLPESVRTQMVDQARQVIQSQIPACSEDTMAGGLPNIVAGRVAFCFDLQGGNVILDAACAASMAALDHALKCLRMGDADMVVMGGSDSTMSASAYVGFCKTYALSARGSSPFDSKADGFVMGEGCGILLLKRLQDAERDEDTIYAVIRGVGSSSDGRGSGITAPSPSGQTLAMQRAYEDTGIDPATIGFVEAHGTSTSVGDAAEFASLMDVFGQLKPQQPIYLGSIKSMIGHLKTAAGVAGLIKAILSVKEGVIPPTLNFESPAARIDLDRSPFHINGDTQTWEHRGSTPRRACINSFGFGGTNFHVVVEAYDPLFYRSPEFEQELLRSRHYQTLIQPLLQAKQPPTVVPTSPVDVSESPAKVASPAALITSTSEITEALQNLQQPLAVIKDRAQGMGLLAAAPESLPSLSTGNLQGWIPAIQPSDLGAPSFRRSHGVRFNYIAGAMAGGIGSAEIVVAMAKAGMLGFFGSGGLDLGRLEKALQDVTTQLADHPQAPFGFNLLHNPIEAEMEDRTVDLYLKYGVKRISASAYLRLMPSVVRYRAKGMRRRADGQIEAPNQVFAKVSSLDVAAQFMAPPPAALLTQLVNQGKITREEAQLAALFPVAEDITAEADSGGHTDRRPLSVLLPQMLRQRDDLAARYRYSQQGVELRVGAAGSMGDPLSVRAALAVGADYILTGSINQSSLQAGTSPLAKTMLAESQMADVVMAPAADMFEMGVQVQVLKRGTLYARRAQKLYEIYKTYPSLESISAEERIKLERDIFRQPLEEVWASTAAYWEKRDPKQLRKAQADAKHKMALTFRAYLGLSSRWAQLGDAERKMNYQIWCGPAMGLFNHWVADTWLQPLENRDVVLMGLALLHGAATLTRADLAAQAGLVLPPRRDLSRVTDQKVLLSYLNGSACG
ncbi:MAG: PfaD family polyunsaturated fatty acid/polyketide biosynthesis protein [Synechococcaceae cyanobacterium SM2_3_1]|nr:PfaD family polyunsaturated fatty acid/polyketide biosynthesis protein [Synechococcaceae cyanobacterium SM2_3_1]